MDVKKKYLLIYHREDNDGVFSGGLLYNYLRFELKIPESDITPMGADYNMLAGWQAQNPPKKLHQQYTNIIMTDVSFNDVTFMKKLYDEFKTDFVWCDHHAPVIKLSFTNGFSDVPGVRETDRSAILCVWKFLYDPFDEDYKEKKIPELLRILSAYDSWTFAQAGYDKKYAADVNKGVTSELDLNFKDVCSYLHDMMSKQPMHKISSIEDFYAQGKLINGNDAKRNRNVIDTDGDFTWTLDKGKRPACAMFIQGGSSSQMFESCQGKALNGIVFKRKPNSNWTISLYNVSDDDTFNCGAYMKEHYGGGGHVGAAGGTVTEDKFIEILKKKAI